MTARRVGVLLLETTYLTVPGAMANPSSFGYPTLHLPVPGARGSVVVSERFAEVTSAYVASARAAQKDGADLLTSNCGFAIAYQEAVARATALPTALSSLLLVPVLARVYGGRLGVLTYDANQLDETRKRMAGWPTEMKIPVADVQGSPAWRALASELPPELHLDQMRSDLVGIARSFIAASSLCAILLECTGMFPFKSDVRRTTGIPVYDLMGLIRYLLSEMGDG